MNKPPERRSNLSTEHLGEIQAYNTLRRFFFDPEARAYATALAWGDDDYEEGGIIIPEPADPTTDCALVPERFRASFERLPPEMRLSVARIYRRALIFDAVCRGRTERPESQITITAAAGIEFDPDTCKWRHVGPAHHLTPA